MPARKALNVLDLIEQDQGQDLPDPRHGLEPRKSLYVVGLGTARKIEFHLAEQLVIVIKERHIYLYRLADTGIGEMVSHVFAVRFVCESFADLGEIVLTIGIVNVGSEFGALARQVTATTEQVAGGPHLRRIDVRLGNHPAA